MYKAEVDVAVLLLFFCRPGPFGQVFEQVRKARPSKLYLYQDGPREGKESDIEGIKKCREIADNIDWECEVHKCYLEKNQGCDPSEYLAQKWMFDTEEYGIVLEDDDVPSVSFFKYCKELLEKYKDNNKINSIMGMNTMEIYKKTNYSYFYTRNGSIWGWASWKRVIDTWDPKYQWLENEEAKMKLKKVMGSNYRSFLDVAQKHRASGIEYYETIMGVSSILFDRVNIVPKYNMISDVGQTEDATHGVADIRLLPKKTRKILEMKRYEIEFPLKHPDKIELIPEVEAFYKRAFGSKWEYYIRAFLFLPKAELVKKIKKKVFGKNGKDM